MNAALKLLVLYDLALLESHLENIIICLNRSLIVAAKRLHSSGGPMTSPAHRVQILQRKPQNWP